MKTHIFTVVAFAVCAGLMLSSCQEDKVEIYGDNSIGVNEVVLEVEDTTLYAPVLSKPAIPRKYDSVYCMNQEFELATATMYKTMKIRNLSGTIVQEWLYEDLRTDLFQYVVHPDDPDGSKHGFYYVWDGNLSDIEPADWEYMLYDANGESVSGFHIPDRADISRLATILGGSKKIPQYLNMDYDGTYNPNASSSVNFKANNAAFWTYPLDDLNQVQGCGVVADWYYPGSSRSDNWITSYTNIAALHVNLRLMRTLTISQW